MTIGAAGLSWSLTLQGDSYAGIPGTLMVQGLSDFFRIPIRQKPLPAQVRDM